MANKKTWIKESEGQNLKFRRETLLNYAMNRWGLNKAYSVGATSELIRSCAPGTFDEWEAFYFEFARQKKKDGIGITREYISDLGRKLYVKLSEVVQNELESISEQECIDYVYNLVLNRTYEGYRTEIETIYGQLEGCLDYKIQPAPDEWDRHFGVDFFIQVKDAYLGLQIKPISAENSINNYQWVEIHRKKHLKFQKKFLGKVFFVYSIKARGKKKTIYNVEVIDEIKSEIRRLEAL
ncbi:MjaI restriction endonuclease [Desulfocicer vacuolatum DSM 3385]|uniref:MjaI restriction endonuclease n=1 Tax=Desulfocicer vacuolatum DSM 3385 TaxID=1121400 RepID=A0A1W2AHD5_9BACT|nr:MjaI family restriction endonuclease [Desulfocicer vacuolatum]SMC60087.1 MjaI restriction endonuclease [Desulfocicer vacuolatum DSM 3385]